MKEEYTLFGRHNINIFLDDINRRVEFLNKRNLSPEEFIKEFEYSSGLFVSYPESFLKIYYKKGGD